MTFPALQTEIVSRPTDNYPGPGVIIWCMWHHAQVYLPVGNRWWDEVVKDTASYVHENHISCAFTVWMYTQPDPEARHFIYLTFPEPLETDALLVEMAENKYAAGTASNGTLPSAAVPVLKREPTGNLLRLWPPPGPVIPEVQRVKYEGAKIRLTNRCYLIEQDGAQMGQA